MLKKVFLTVLLILLMITGYLAYHTFAYTYKTAVYDETPGSESYQFFWSSPDEQYLVRLRDNFGLEGVIKGAEDDFGKLKKINSWVNNLWSHHGGNQPERNDPIYIMEQVKKGERYRCVEYSIVVSGCLNAVGIPSRVLGLKMHNVEINLLGAGHVVSEAYLEDLDKWVMLDGQWDIIPILNGEPLSALELQQALAEEKEGLGVISSSEVEPEEYFRWIRPYLYYMDVNFDQRVSDEITDRRKKGNLMLLPEGARKPLRFQLLWGPIQSTDYTYSADAFYRSPTG